jgi:hypothetical protein
VTVRQSYSRSLLPVHLSQADDTPPAELPSEPEGSEPVDVEAEAEPEAPPMAEPEPEAPPMAETEPIMDLDEASIAKEALKAEVADGLSGSKPDRAVVGEILLALEAQNPTSSPATSELLNGKWKFLYASGTSPGLKALTLLLKGSKSLRSPSGADLVDVGDTFLTISSEQPRAMSEVSVRLLSFENKVRLASKLEAESAVRLVETYDAAESEYMNLRLPFQSPAQFKRSVLVSYLDEEMLVVRDSLGRPDVLMRIDKPTSTWAPSSLDGDETNDADDAPGAS